MEIIKPPKFYKGNKIKIFLAGGITNCGNWQDKVIKALADYDVVIFNPRRDSFDITNKSETERQIEWEFNALNQCDIFTMYFCGGESLQPICMYELGRNILYQQKQYAHWQDKIVISAEKSYKRFDDVVIQTRLATNNLVTVNTSLEEHINKIIEKI